jgi:hypothetical protein
MREGRWARGRVRGFGRVQIQCVTLILGQPRNWGRKGAWMVPYLGTVLGEAWHDA